MRSIDYGMVYPGIHNFLTNTRTRDYPEKDLWVLLENNFGFRVDLLNSPTTMVYIVDEQKFVLFLLKYGCRK